MLFDAHTHLNFEEYSDEERAALAAEIEASDVGLIIDAGDSVESSKQSVADADAYPWCYAAVGIHPEHAGDYRGICSGDPQERAVADKKLRADLDEIRKLAAHPKAVAIGEIGLDFYYGKDDHAEQEELFRRQIRLANELRMPIMIHSRDAHKLTMDILTEEGAFSEERKSWFPGRPAGGVLAADEGSDEIKMARQHTGRAEAEACPYNSGVQAGSIQTRTHSGPAVFGSENKSVAASCSEPEMRMVPDARVQLHCFSGSPELAEEYVKIGATISLGGPITFKNGKKAAEVARGIPLEFLLSETDAPFLAPEPFRGRPNKSPYIEHVVRRMALLKGMEYEEAARILEENGRRFFGIEAVH